MKYIALAGYGFGLALMYYAWPTKLPLGWKISITGLGVGIAVGAAFFQWFRVKNVQ